MTEKLRQRRRLLLVLPALTLPFITLLFWALGGGRGASAQTASTGSPGLNLKLPDAHFDGRETWDKFNLYEMARQDSARSHAARQNDPYYELPPTETAMPVSADEQGGLVSEFRTKGDQVPSDPNEARVQAKLGELYRELERANSTPGQSVQNNPIGGQPVTSQESFSTDVDRLEKMMTMMHEDTAPDPEMQQIENVLDKILKIQYPDKETGFPDPRGAREAHPSLSVNPVKEEIFVSLLERGNPVLGDFTDSLYSSDSPFAINGFWGIEEPSLPPGNTANAIQAMIHDTQRLVDGAMVRLRLLEEIEIAGYRLKTGQFAYGACAIAGERLTIRINSLRVGSSILPVALAVYDLDGVEGIHVPSAITRDAAKQASGNALQNVQMMSLDPTLSAQAASVGVEAAKGLFGRKAQQISVIVKAGYRVLLREVNPNNPSR